MPKVVDDRRFAGTGNQRPVQLLFGDRFTNSPRQLRRSPEISLITAPEVVVLRPGDGEVSTGNVVNREAPRDRLLVQRLGIAIECMGLAGLRFAFRPQHMLDISKR